MAVRELVLLTTYEPPARYPLMLGADDSAAWLHAYLALWHPDALLGATGPPKIAAPHDHETPAAGTLYAVPETPPLYLNELWDDDVVSNGAAAFRSAGARGGTFGNLQLAVVALGQQWRDWPADAVHRFLGVGLGYLTVETLFAAMDHERLLDEAGFWADVQAAAASPDGYVAHLKAAAQKLLSAREVVYPVTVYLLDFALLDDVPPGQPWPASFERGVPVNLIGSAATLAKLPAAQLARIRERIAADADAVELCGGLDHERADTLLPLESQLWNVRRGQARLKELVGAPAGTLARRTADFQPATPLLAQQHGIGRAVYVAFDDGRVPSHPSTAIQWPSPDGRQVEAFTRPPHDAADPQVFFHLAHHLHTTVANDSAATLAFRHGTVPAGPWYDDLLALGELAPVVGTWHTLARYFRDAPTAEYTPAAQGDDFALDVLDPRVTAQHPRAVSGFARHLKLRRRFDAGQAYRALLRVLGTPPPDAADDLEDRLERTPDDAVADVEAFEQSAAQALAARLTARSTGDVPGLLLLNPCGFARRATVERDDFAGPPPVAGPVKAAQADRGTVRLVVDVPPLGFAWLPRGGGAAAEPAGTARADARGLRNEFFDAEVDPATGGLKAIRAARERGNRVGVQLAYGPGGRMAAHEVKVTSPGPVLAEAFATGHLLDERDQPVCGYRLRYRAWHGRPLLELRVEIVPERPLEGYPWHAYLAARFAWRDPAAALTRGVLGQAYPTTHTRPVSGEFVEVHSGGTKVCVLPNGLPFHQRHGPRMLDVILRTPHETAQQFDLAVGLDRDWPAQLALGLASPVTAVPTVGEPAVKTGWLCHLDAPNLLLSSLRPHGESTVEARLLECTGYGGSAALRFARNPTAGLAVDADGQALTELLIDGDAAGFDVGAFDLAQVRVTF